MTITINIPNEELFDKILWLLSHFKSDGVEIITTHKKEKPNQKRPKNKFFEFAGIWKDRDITQESIRKEAWK